MKKISYYRLFIYMLLLNSFVSLTYSIYPSNLNVGKIVGAVLIIVLIAIYVKTLKKRDIFYLLFICIFDLLTIFRISDVSIDIENIMFFTSTTMILWKFSELSVREKMKSEFNKMSDKVFKITNIMLGVSIISLLFSSSWVVVNGQRVLYGFCDSGHKMAGNLCFLSSIYFLYFINKNMKIRDLFYFAIIFVIILSTGSRTYLISYFIIMLLLYLKKLRQYSIIKLFMPFIVICGIYLFINSSIFARFFLMGENQYISENFWEATSSGRLIWWKIDLEAFSNFNIINKIFGKGFTYLYNLNLVEYGLRISAHNDFLTLIVSTGWFGLLGYLIILKSWFFKINYNKRKLIDIVFTILLFIINAMLSGVYGAQQYIFCNLIISLVLLEDKLNYEKKKENTKNELYNIR